MIRELPSLSKGERAVATASERLQSFSPRVWRRISAHGLAREGTMTGYVAIVIGAGQAGPFLARRLAAAGMNVAVIERGLIGARAPTRGAR